MLLRNETEAGNWLQVKVRDTAREGRTVVDVILDGARAGGARVAHGRAVVWDNLGRMLVIDVGQRRLEADIRLR